MYNCCEERTQLQVMQLKDVPQNLESSWYPEQKAYGIFFFIELLQNELCGKQKHDTTFSIFCRHDAITSSKKAKVRL